MLLRIDLFAHAKICKLSVALHGQHHIFWFDVTVDITLKVDWSNQRRKKQHLLMKKFKSKNKFCCMEGSSLLVKSFALKNIHISFFILLKYCIDTSAM